MTPAEGTEVEVERQPPDGQGLQPALEIAFRLLAKRDRTVAEVRQRLERGGVEPGLAEQAITTLTEQGYLDDARFARRFAEDRRNLDGWGSIRIEQRLVALGIHAAQAAAAAARGPDEELQAAIALLRRRLSHPGAAGDRERDRALGLLLRRGYEVELARDAIRAYERGGA